MRGITTIVPTDTVFPPPPPDMPTPQKGLAGARTPKSEKKFRRSVTSSSIGGPPPGQLPHHKAGRVKVGVRCRPPFQDEIDYAKKNSGEFIPIIETRAEHLDSSSLGQVSLLMSSGKQREFMYDYVFGTKCTQDYVYDRIARPVVTDVLRGFNGTIFAYGQTGTGKLLTYDINS